MLKSVESALRKLIKMFLKDVYIRTFTIIMEKGFWGQNMQKFGDKFKKGITQFRETI